MNDLLSKHGKSVTELAKLLLHHQIGDRIPAVQQIATDQGLSVGTVQAAISHLQALGFAEFEMRGRLGAFVQTLDYAGLWALAYRRPLIGALPMPYSKRFEGLATGLRAAFEGVRCDLDLRYSRGATARFAWLHGRQCDFAVVSRYAAETAWAHGFDVYPVVALGQDTYTVNQVLVLRGGALRDGLRVGIDMHSADHAYMVRLLTKGYRVNFISIDYSTSIDLLLRGEIDATVWTAHDLPALPPDVTVINAADLAPTDEQAARLGEGVIVVLSDHLPARHALAAVVNVDDLRAVQTAVIEGRRLPAY